MPILRKILSMYFNFWRLSKFLISRGQISEWSRDKNGNNDLPLILGLAHIWTLIMQYCSSMKALVKKTNILLSSSPNPLTPREHSANKGKISWAFPRPDYFVGQASHGLQAIRAHASPEPPEAHWNFTSLIFFPEDEAFISLSQCQVISGFFLRWLNQSVTSR